MHTDRPYLIFPKFVEQPTWGGAYIAHYKDWGGKSGISDKRIGQSYELSGDSIMSGSVSDTSDPRFTGYFNSPSRELVESGETISLRQSVETSGTQILGADIYRVFRKMPLLIKFTQALGNSFQLHVKRSSGHTAWLPKAESWYFLEKGKITLGVRPGTEIGKYKLCCLRIESFMKSQSVSVQSGKTSIEEARMQTSSFIRELDPWQYVNVHETERGELIDLSGGGLHHSWEEDDSRPEGNIVYEVQEDVSDDRATLRSFDQGKIKDDGSIRPITIYDYFKYLDTDPDINDIGKARVTPDGEHFLKTRFYSMDRVVLPEVRTETTGTSFHHLWVVSGRVTVSAHGGTVTAGKGHSCFIPHAAESYTVTPESKGTVILKTFIQQSE